MPRGDESAPEFDYSVLIQYRSMHRIYTPLNTGKPSQTFNQFSEVWKRIVSNSFLTDFFLLKEEDIFARKLVDNGAST